MKIESLNSSKKVATYLTNRMLDCGKEVSYISARRSALICIHFLLDTMLPETIGNTVDVNKLKGAKEIIMYEIETYQHKD